jgi:hypothetical protein
MVFVADFEWPKDKSEPLIPMFSDMVFHFYKIKFWHLIVTIYNRDKTFLNLLIHLFELFFQSSWTPVNISTFAWEFIGLKFMNSKINASEEWLKFVNQLFRFSLGVKLPLLHRQVNEVSLFSSWMYGEVGKGLFNNLDWLVEIGDDDCVENLRQLLC